MQYREFLVDHELKELTKHESVISGQEIKKFIYSFPQPRSVQL